MQTDLNELKLQRDRVKVVFDDLYERVKRVYETEKYDSNVKVYEHDGYSYFAIEFNDLNLEIAALPNFINQAGGFGFKDDNIFISFAILPEDIDVKFDFDLRKGLKLLLDVFKDHSLAVLHELIHVDDFNTGLISKEDSSNSRSNLEYYNHPMELHAYLQEILFIIEEDFILNYGKKEKYTKAELDRYFELFIKNRKRERLNLPQYKYLTKENYFSMLDICKQFIYNHVE